MFQAVKKPKTRKSANLTQKINYFHLQLAIGATRKKIAGDFRSKFEPHLVPSFHSLEVRTGRCPNGG